MTRRRWLFVLLLLIPAWALAVDTPTNEKEIAKFYHFYDSLASQWVTADSGYSVAMYPSEEDTTGKRVDFIYIGGVDYAWKLEVRDSTDVWDFFVRDTTGGAWVALPRQQDVRIEGRHAPEGWINDQRAFAAGVIQAKLAAEGSVSIEVGDSTGVFEADSVRAFYLDAALANIASDLIVQGGVPPSASSAIFHVDDGEVQVQTVPLVADTLHVLEGALFDGIVYGDTLQPVGTHITVLDSLRVVGSAHVTEDLTVADDLDVDGATSLSSFSASSTMNLTSPLATHQIEGSLTIGNDLIVEDNADVDGRLDVDEHADIADSTQLGSSYTAADSLAAAAVLHGWLVIDNTYAFTVRLDSGDDQVIVKVPGVRTGDLVFAAAQVNDGSTSPTSNFTWQRVRGPGEILIERGGTIGNLDLSVLVVKIRNL